MALATLVLACFLSYSTSRYFPTNHFDFVQKHPKAILIASMVLSGGALLLFWRAYDFATAFIIWMTAYMALLAAIVVSLTINIKSIWLWGGLCLVSIMLDLA